MLRTALILFTCLFAFQLNAQNLETGKKDIKLERYSDAIEFFQNVQKQNPTNSDAYYYLGKTYLIRKDIAAAEKSFADGISKDKDNPLNYVGMTGISLLKKDSVAAESNIEMILDLTGKKSYPIIELAEIYYLVKGLNYNRAIDLLNRLSIVDKKFVKNDTFYVNLGNLYLEMNNGSQARENYQNAIYNNPNNVEAQLKIGEIYLRIKGYKEAEEYLTKALSIDSNYTTTHYILADFYGSTKQYGKAAAAYKKYIDLSEKDILKYERYAELLFLNKNYAEAIEAVKTLSTAGEIDLQTQHLLAYCYYFLDDYTNGIPEFTKYFEKADSTVLLASDYEYLGKLYAKAGNDSLTIVNYTQAIKMDTSLVSRYGDIAEIYFKNKNWENAITHFKLKDSLNTAGLNIKEGFDYGITLMLLKRFAEADTVFGRIIKSKPDLPLAYLKRAQTNAYIDTTSELGLAKPYYEKFIELATASKDSAKYKNDLIVAHSYLGYYFYIKCESLECEESWVEGYKKNWERVITLDPANKQAADALKSIPKAKKGR